MVRNGVTIKIISGISKAILKGKCMTRLRHLVCILTMHLTVRTMWSLLSPLFKIVSKMNLYVWGRVGCCDPPNLVMPLTVEVTKPRLCHDERFLNLWVIDKPFVLAKTVMIDTLG